MRIRVGSYRSLNFFLAPDLAIRNMDDHSDYLAGLISDECDTSRVTGDGQEFEERSPSGRVAEIGQRSASVQESRLVSMTACLAGSHEIDLSPAAQRSTWGRISSDCGCFVPVISYRLPGTQFPNCRPSAQIAGRRVTVSDLPSHLSNEEMALLLTNRLEKRSFLAP